MGTYIVRGGRKIEGEFVVRGSKNGTLPLLAASLLAEDEVVLDNIPLISDVLQTLDILREVGCKIEQTGRMVIIDSRCLLTAEIGNSSVRKIDYDSLGLTLKLPLSPCINVLLPSCGFPCGLLRLPLAVRRPCVGHCHVVGAAECGDRGHLTLRNKVLTLYDERQTKTTAGGDFSSAKSNETNLKSTRHP